MSFDLNTRLADLTIGELLTILSSTSGTGTILSKQVAEQSDVVYGLKGLADLFGVSVSQAKRIKASGFLKGCIAQSGRTLVIDRQKALEAYFKVHKI